MGEDPKGFFGFLMMAVVPLLIFFHYLDIRKRKSTKTEQVAPKSDEWEYGDEWKNASDEVDISNWEELVATLSKQPRIYPRHGEIDNNILDDVPDLVKIQEALFEHHIQSRIGRSRQTTFPADAVFVEKKDFEKAKKILENPESY